VAGVGAAAVVLAWLPILAGAWDGRWQQRTTGFDAQFSWMAAKRTTGDFRVLWVGAPEVLPVAGWPVTDGLAYGTSRNGTPTLIDSWLGTSHGTGRLLAQAIELIRRGDTAQAGHLLAPMGVRYVVTVEALAPLDTNRRDVRPLPPDLTSGMSSQLDLFPIDRSPQATVYENAAWFPTRAPVSDQVARVAALDDPRSARSVDVTRAAPALTHQSGPTSFSGDVPAGPRSVGGAPSGHWQLSVAGHSAPRQPAFASANLFTVPTAGHGHLSYRVPIGWRLADLMGILLWLGALWLVI